MFQLKLTARGHILDVHWPQTRKHDVITFLIKSMCGHIKPSECVMCVVHLFKSPIFPVKRHFAKSFTAG